MLRRSVSSVWGNRSMHAVGRRNFSLGKLPVTLREMEIGKKCSTVVSTVKENKMVKKMCEIDEKIDRGLDQVIEKMRHKIKDTKFVLIYLGLPTLFVGCVVAQPYLKNLQKEMRRW